MSNNRLKWTDEYIRFYVKDLVNKENLSRETIPSVMTIRYLNANGLGTPLVSRFNNNIYNLIKFVYPDMYTKEEFKSLAKKQRKTLYWTKENFIKHVKEMVEYENLHMDDIPKIVSSRYLIGKGFAHPLSKFTNGSAYKTFELVYPNRFKKEDFIKWSKIRRILNISPLSKEDTIKKVREQAKIELRMEIEDIPKKITYNDIIKLGIEKPFRKYFNNNFYKLFDEVFPNKFKKEDFVNSVNNKSYKIRINKKTTN